jgi:CheY-like chemotaxis protein
MAIMSTQHPEMETGARSSQPDAREIDPSSDAATQSAEGLTSAIRRVAHDLNNTLTVIQGNAELARADLIPQHPAWESVVEIRDAGIKARDRVKMILDLCHRFQERAQPASGISPAAKPPAEAAPSATSHVCHLLILDDEPELISMAERLLKKRGIKVVGFTHATQALAVLRARPNLFDGVVVDLNMAGISGIQVALEMRRIAPNIPLVLVSGLARDQEQAEAKRLGLGEILVKPDTFDAFAELIERSLVAKGTASGTTLPGHG